MRNPLPAALWFLHQDALEGLLEENGFSRQHSTASGQTLFRRDRFVLHQNGFWVEESSGHLVYRNSTRCFSRLQKDRDPLAPPRSGEVKVGLEEGFEAVADLLHAHEHFIEQRCGRGYRQRLIQTMPRAERRYAKNWKLLLGAERRPITM